MDPTDKAILVSLYICSLDHTQTPLERIRAHYLLPADLYMRRIEDLISKGFVERHTNRLTFIGRDAIKVVLVGGVFDLIHPGHIRTLLGARSHGDVLVVVVARTSTAQKIKKYRQVFHDEELRKELVSSLSFVDLAVIGSERSLYDTVEFIKPDIIALGYDQTHSEKEIAENCRKRDLNTRVIRLNTPVPGIKSSKIKEELGESIYGI
ncbi:MAG TPA: adenylyltransferase/cytidyltransferase family protein [Nitrososphaeraceae archaeon]|jgi:glycerol-3-phosphate cytidylyltransferase/FAD synthetase